MVDPSGAPREWVVPGSTKSLRLSGNLNRNSRTLRTLLACEARVDALNAHNPRDLAMAAELEALPATPLPLAAAVSLCMGRDGYIPALAQSALLQTYGGVGVATAAQSLADDAEPYCNDRSPSKRQLEAVTAPRTMKTRERMMPLTRGHTAACFSALRTTRF